uniref:Rab3 GTPase-activating protein catalytic subunit-like n=1 Tax=Castor canadensis TaxID=51338 RepID=A0A8B7UY78_CASCN|nr:rab3 GTPase-activating protein catalytic subunit-like [Castor canadensis]
MAADSEPESEVFEITDFTTASEWERFISKVEEVLNDWKLIGNSVGRSLEKVRLFAGVSQLVFNLKSLFLIPFLHLAHLN